MHLWFMVLFLHFEIFKAIKFAHLVMSDKHETIKQFIKLFGCHVQFYCAKCLVLTVVDSLDKTNFLLGL